METNKKYDLKVQMDSTIYYLSEARPKKDDLCLSLYDDEGYGQEFVYDGRFDDMSNEELEESCLLEETYIILDKKELHKPKKTKFTDEDLLAIFNAGMLCKEVNGNPAEYFEKIKENL